MGLNLHSTTMSLHTVKCNSIVYFHNRHSNSVTALHASTSSYNIFLDLNSNTWRTISTISDVNINNQFNNILHRTYTWPQSNQNARDVFIHTWNSRYWPNDTTPWMHTHRISGLFREKCNALSILTALGTLHRKYTQIKHAFKKHEPTYDMTTICEVYLKSRNTDGE